MYAAKEWTVSRLRHLVGKHISALEMAGGKSCAAQVSVKPISKYTPREAIGHSYYPKSTAKGLLTGSTRSSTVNKQHPVSMKCNYCGQAIGLTNVLSILPYIPERIN